MSRVTANLKEARGTAVPSGIHATGTPPPFGLSQTEVGAALGRDRGRRTRLGIHIEKTTRQWWNLGVTTTNALAGCFVFQASPSASIVSDRRPGQGRLLPPVCESPKGQRCVGRVKARRGGGVQDFVKTYGEQRPVLKRYRGKGMQLPITQPECQVSPPFREEPFFWVRQAWRVARKRNQLGYGGHAGDWEVKVLYTPGKGKC